MMLQIASDKLPIHLSAAVSVVKTFPQFWSYLLVVSTGQFPLLVEINILLVGFLQSLLFPAQLYGLDVLQLTDHTVGVWD